MTRLSDSEYKKRKDPARECVTHHYCECTAATLARYHAALTTIAGEDYRGNRPHSATIAWRALHPDETTQ